MARPKETDEQKVKKVYPDARYEWYFGNDNTLWHYIYRDNSPIKPCLSMSESEDLAWQDALTQIRKAKIKAAKDKRKPPKVVKEIKKHVGLTMYDSNKAMIVKVFGSVQKFLDLSIREYKDRK